MTKENKLKIVLLIGNKLWNKNTLLDFKKSDLNIVGVCVYDDSFFGFPIKYIIKSIIKKGFFKVIDQILGRIFYKVINFNFDRKKLKEIFDIKECKRVLKELNVPIYVTNSYNNKKTLEWISNLSPDIIVVHSHGLVGKILRETPKTGLIIGSHPGITPNYRGSHSAFWAIYNGEKEKIGYSIFHINEEIDAGDLIFQKKIEILKNESYISLGWRCMKEISKKQIEILEEYEKTKKISKIKHEAIPVNSEYSIPGLSHYIRYLRIQKDFR